MRVIAGTARSLPLKTPKGMETRPTTDRIKETLFNMLQNQVPGSVFVDCFAGSGGIGIEAISRGAIKAYFLDNAPTAIGCIEENIKFTKFTDKAVILKSDVSSGLYSINEKHLDIVFMDPPYGQGLENGPLSILKNMKSVDSDTLIIVEEKLDEDFSFVSDLGFEIIKEKKYKTNKHVFLRVI